MYIRVTPRAVNTQSGCWLISTQLLYKCQAGKVNYFKMVDKQNISTVVLKMSDKEKVSPLILKNNTIAAQLQEASKPYQKKTNRGVKKAEE